MSIMTKMVDALEAVEIRAYLPGRAPGGCQSAHAIVTDGGRVPLGKTTGRHIYYVTACVPAARPGDLTELTRRIGDALVGLRELRATGDVSESFFDDEKGAYCAAVEFSALCAL